MSLIKVVILASLVSTLTRATPVLLTHQPLFAGLQVLDEIRPYLVGTGGGGLDLVSIDGPIVKVQITGPAASVMTVRVAVTQKLREKIPSIAGMCNQLRSPGPRCRW